MRLSVTRTVAVAALAIPLLGATGASAADLGSGNDRYLEPLPIEHAGLYSRWTSFYLGGTLGLGWGDGRTGGAIGTFDFEQSGALGTVFAGYNWQLGQTIFGVEADVGTGDFGASEPTAFGTLHTSLNAMGSLRARAGFLMSPSLLVYGTAGLAWADMDFQIAGTPARSETFFGYQVGLGGELMISDHVNLRLEYIYTGLPEERVIHSGLNNTYDPSFNTVRAGISLKF